jgi:hypothetical protein
MDLGLEESDSGKKYSASFKIVDPPPPETKIEEAGAKQKTRIAVQSENKDAEIALADADGKERIRLKVDADGAGVFRFSTTMARSFLLRRNESSHTISSNQPLRATPSGAGKG